ncbi:MULTISPECIES: hypothetical protein [unclassified Kitasatospora]|uniref:hypothetical protein n=1 Tax=unclassified Kitasatospora TaxID=2633591 RepID=UPI00070D8C8E|nr:MULTISPECIES: hypothetical protein [unclassified Kitasatospora]KQV18645.1 hypothetical protein ASC99_05365 [Kitasatospora sp. Root107]KRB74627.1 hypothetical protein ASE03_19300 [Kitasatospora sp. Root187]
MQQDDAVLGAALAVGERSYRNTTRLGGVDLSSQIQAWKVDRAYTTDLPQAMRAFSGSSSAQLDLELAGTGGVSAPALYSPWSGRITGDVVRPGQSVVQLSGLGAGVQLPVFRGTVRNRSADSGTDTVRISALDGAERLRGPALLPKPYLGFSANSRQPVASATWCVDELLRQAGILTCPPARAPDYQTGKPYTLLHASLHGGVTPGIGTLELVPDARHYRWSRSAAPYEMALVPTQPGVQMGWMPRSRVLFPGPGTLLEATFNSLAGAGNKAVFKLYLDRLGKDFGLLKFSVDFAAGTLEFWSGTMKESGVEEGVAQSWSFPALAQRRGVWQLGLLIDSAWSLMSEYDASGDWISNEIMAIPFLRGEDGTVLQGNFAELGGLGKQLASELYRVDLVTDVATEGVQLTKGYNLQSPIAADFKQSWTKGATLDEVTLPLYNIPAVSGSQWETISQIAKAAIGTAEFDESGIFRWRNHTRFSSRPTTAQRTVTTLREIASLTVSEEIDACRNYCVQPYQDWSKVDVVVGETYADAEVRSIPPQGRVEIAYSVGEGDFDIFAPLVDDDVLAAGGSALRFAPTSPPYVMAPAVKGRVETRIQRDGGTVYLTLESWSPNTVYTVNRDGSPSVRLVTYKPSADPVVRTVVAQSVASQAKYGRQQYSAEGSDWVQDQRTASDLAKALLNAGIYPVPVFGGVDVLYDPTLQLGDVVRVVDTAGAALDTMAWVVGMSVEAGRDGAVRQTLTLRGTDYNSVPLDAPGADQPVDPAAWNTRTYAQVAGSYPTLAALTASGRSYKGLHSN